ncbi:MAG: TRZ/ATZ family hydrolase [Pseudomonadota bacterium]
MQQIETIIDAGWIIPVEPVGAVFENHSLVIDEGRIVGILPQAEAAAKYLSQHRVSLPQHALIPGLVNCHTHAAMSLMRGLADDLPLMSWLQDHIWPAEGKWVSEGFVYDGTRLAMAEMLRSGTTCFNDMYFFPDQAARAVNEAHMRACLGMIMIDFPSAWAQNADEYLHKGLALRDQVHNHPLITTAFAPHAPYTVSDAPLEKIQMYAEELDVPIHMHVHETDDEVGGEVSKTGKRPLARLDALGLLSPRLMAVHMTQLHEDEIARLAETGVHVLHCPESNLKLASGFCPTHALNQAGVNLALGTDGAASNNDLDMLGEMRTAALIAKAVAYDASALAAPQALRTATLGGAKALGLDHEIGSLTVGKAADITAIHLGDIESLPVYNPISQIVYTAGRNQVTDVWVAGKRLLKDRRLTTLDEAEMRAKAREWQARLKQFD